MGRGMARLVVFLVVAALAAACSDNGSMHPTAAAAHQLRLAAHRTLAEPSYKIRMGEVDVKHPHVVTARYQAPDRSSSGSGRNEMIEIGNTSYIRNPDGSGIYTRMTMPANVSTAIGAANAATASLASVLYPAEHVRKNVSVDGSTYVATTAKHGDFGPARYIYRVSNGRITDLRIEQRLRRKPWNREFHYFDFGVPNVIKPPPADRVEDSVPTPQCPPGGLSSTNPGTTIQACVGEVTSVPSMRSDG